ncbi:hypothetical protein ACFW0B_23560, partial [Pseudomonas sp. CR1201]
VVASLPASLEPDALYLVRAGAGFDLYATNHAGTVVSYPLNLPDLSAKQDAHANLSALSGVTGSAGAVFYFTAAGAGALAASSSLGRQLWNIIDEAAGRTLLGLGTAATANATTSPTDTTPGRLWRTNDLFKQANQLDSSAGRVLVMGNSGVGPFGLGDVGYTLSDVDHLTFSGLGRVVSLGTPNAPTVGVGYGIGMPHAAGMTTLGGQLFLNYTTDSGNYVPFPRLFARSKSSAAAFGSWAEFYSDRNILGTVGQASGIPTGAIIERGSNANGAYVKFADGTLICTHTVTANTAIATAFLGGFRGAGQLWAYPAGFVAAPSFSAVPVSLNAISGVGTGVGINSATWVATAVDSQTAANITMSLLAIGRWF